MFQFHSEFRRRNEWRYLPKYQILLSTRNRSARSPSRGEEQYSQCQKIHVFSPPLFFFQVVYGFFLSMLTKHGLSGALSTQKQRLILSPELVSYWSDCWLIVAYLSWISWTNWIVMTKLKWLWQVLIREKWTRRRNQMHNQHAINFAQQTWFLQKVGNCTVAQKTVPMFTHFGIIDLLWHANITKNFGYFRQSIMASWLFKKSIIM